jgi:hypothetical protein
MAVPITIADIISVIASKISAQEWMLEYSSYLGGPHAYANPILLFGQTRLQVLPLGHPFMHPFCDECIILSRSSLISNTKLTSEMGALPGLGVPKGR